jgi:DNA-binding NtrC family response regulator
MGLSATRENEKEFAFNNSLKEAAEMGLTPLVAECALHIGALRFWRGDYVEARDYLSRSVSITKRLAEALSPPDRERYLSIQFHGQARKLLNSACEQAQSLPLKLPELLGMEGSFFVQLYRLSASMTAAGDLKAATAALMDVLRQSLDHPAVVVMGSGAGMVCHSVRAELSNQGKEHVVEISRVANGKTYIVGPGMNRRDDTAFWTPILSQAVQGGIYVEHLRGQPALDEREIEFLTIVAAIAGAAFDRVCSRNHAIPELSAANVHGIVGSSSAITDVHARIQIAAANTATVLIEGESGTGKELAARAIHEQGPRAKGPFVPVDCGALPEGLIEAEMFGTRKGAYTGAVADRHGLFEAADHGTIFLDEISNIGLAAQAKLLRVLQEKEVRRVGSVSGRTVDVRVIAATNCDLERLVREGKFRQDLLYRLKVLHIVLPPLRERKSDIPMLATTFLERLNAANHTRKYFGPGVLESFLEHTFPGNVRELQNAVERGFYSTSGPVIAGIEFSREKPGKEERDEDTESWFRELTEGKRDFWSAVHDRYKRRDISRESVIALMDIGLRAAHGNYKVMASMFQIPKEQYRRFMDFLRRNQCLLDFRPYRKARAPERTF